MNEKSDSNAGPLSARDSGFGPRPGKHRTNGHDRFDPARERGSGLDFWTVANILAQRWHWLVMGGILGAAGFFILGWYMIQPGYAALTQLIRYETPGTSEFLKTTPLTSETFAGLIASPDLLARVGRQVDPPIPPDRLVKILKVDPQVDSDIVKVSVSAREPQQAVDLANLYAGETVAFTREMQATQAEVVAKTYLHQELAQMDEDIQALHDKFSGMPVSPQMTNKLAQVSNVVSEMNQNLAAPRTSLLIQKQQEQLQLAIADLAELTRKYTDLHPRVQEKRAEIQSLQNQMAEEASNNPTGPISIASNGQVLEPDLEVVRAKLRSLEDARVQMETRQHEAELLASNPPGVVRVLAPATLKTVKDNKRWIKIGLIAIFGGMLGLASSLGLLLLVEVTDRRVRTVDDLMRVTKLPVLTTLGDLREMEETDRTQWAFRTWTMLQGRLSRSQHHGLVCGVTSSIPGEGRSTWIHLMAEAASLAGFKVLTIATRPSPTHIESPDQLTEETPNQPSEMNMNSELNNPEALTPNVLATPSQVTEQLTGPNPRPVVHIPLPGWVWNLDRRKQWRDALNQWRQIDNLVIFVELPSASVPEAVLLGSNLPNLLWLTDSGRADAAETRAQLETLRYARCNLVGAVLNREPARSVKGLFPRWVGCLALFLALGLSVGHSQQTNPESSTPLPMDAPPETNAVAPRTTADAGVSFSVVNPVQRASWQQHLTLGPGDVLNISLYGDTTVMKAEMAVGPDGRLSYLEAHDILVTGLTVDELRQKFDDELGKYRRAARTIITPVSFHSKKYFMLGKVVQKGVYTLDRPITVLEALARAKGFENGQVDYDTVDLADLQRAFLMRGGKRYSLDFEKLFQGGDLSQNIQIEPGDYLYFPSADVQQVYVLGEVTLPGAVTYRPDMSVAAAISSRGGFNEKAYKSHVLVVRGSLNHPETFVVDMMDIMNGKAPDFRLKPKDIVYVTWRPFIRGEELLDLAITAFIQSAISTAAGVDVVSPVP